MYIYKNIMYGGHRFMLQICEGVAILLLLHQKEIGKCEESRDASKNIYRSLQTMEKKLNKRHRNIITLTLRLA